MNPDTTRLLIQKIERLYSAMEIDNGHLSSIERDLMLSYIRQLYEQFLNSSPKTEDNNRSSGIDGQKQEPVRNHSVDSQPQQQQQQQQAPQLQPKHPPSQPIQPTHPPKAPQPETPEPAPVASPQPATRIEPPRSPVPDPEVETLFEQEQARELADKLGSSPLDDLTIAFSINDRQLFTNELFGRDHDVFTMTLQQLNAMRTFAEARDFLSRHIARKFRWTDKQRKNTAKAFIKTIRRKFP